MGYRIRVCAALSHLGVLGRVSGHLVLFDIIRVALLGCGEIGETQDT